MLKESDWYDLTYDQLKSNIQTKNPDFFLVFGEAVANSGLNQRRTFEAMERVADASESGIPNTYKFTKGITDELTSFDFSLFGDASIELATSIVEKGNMVTDAVGDVVEGATKGVSGIGDTISNAGLISKIGIGMVLLIGGFLLYKKGNKLV